MNAPTPPRTGAVLVTGATGMLGRALLSRLQSQGTHVHAWVRDPARAARTLGAEVTFVPVEDGDEGLIRSLGECDAVVNLAGENVMAKRWSAARLRQLSDSRVGVTERLVKAMARARPTPRVLVSASAVGYYGDCADERLTEQAAPGDTVLARLCADWERAALDAEPLGARVVLLRTGVVLGPEGGALEVMRPLFALGLGGPLGDGRQFVPWVHQDDVVEVAVRALTDERMRGPFNVTAPEPVRFRELSTALGRALGRPAVLPAPSPALRLVLGQRAEAVLHSQRAVPERLQALGYHFHHTALQAALRSAVGNTAVAPRP